jgi:PPOX class probable F420-dependent enzyme
LKLDSLDERALQLLRGKNFAFVASLNHDGSPHVTPTWVDTDGENVLINTAIGRVKQKNTAQDSRVAIAVVDQANPYDALLVEGFVLEQVTGTLAENHIDKLAKKYLGLDKYRRTQQGEKRVVLKIKVKRILNRPGSR